VVVQLPKADAVASLLTDLVGKRVRCKGAARLAPGAVRSLATYVDATGSARYFALADVPFLAGIGAALAMIPPGIVADAVRCGKPSAALMENAYEVMNIAASLFNQGDETRHVKIEALDLVSAIPADPHAKIARAVARIDVEVELTGYPVGKLTLVAV